MAQAPLDAPKRDPLAVVPGAALKEAKATLSYIQNELTKVPLYTSGRHDLSGYFDGLTDPKKFQMRVVGGAANGEFQYLEIKRLLPFKGKDELPIRLYPQNTLFLGYSQQPIEGTTVPFVHSKEAKEIGDLSEAISVVFPKGAQSRSTPTTSDQRESALISFLDTAGHERNHGFGGSEIAARETESRFKGKPYQAIFEDMMDNVSTYSVKAVAKSFADYFLEKKIETVNGAPNPLLKSWFGGRSFESMRNKLIAKAGNPEKNISMLNQKLKELAEDKEISSQESDMRELVYVTEISRQQDLVEKKERLLKNYANFTVSNPDVRTGIILAFQGQRIKDVADKYRDTPLLPEPLRTQRGKEFETRRLAVREAATKEAEAFLLLLEK